MTTASALMKIIFLVIPLYMADKTNKLYHMYEDASCCRFSELFHRADWEDDKTRKLFISRVLGAERRFFAEAGVAFDPDTGMTYDGHALDESTGELKRGPPPAGPFGFSAASKEALHVSLLALAVEKEQVGEGTAKLIYSEDEALQLLEKKVSSMEAMDAAEPGFGGFLPWFCSRGVKQGPDRRCLTPQEEASTLGATNDFVGKVPGLDNGQLAWATYAVSKVLRSRAQEGPRYASLATRWEQRLQRMRTTAVPIFYAGSGTGALRAVARIRNTTQDALNASDYETVPLHPSYLDDAYEGELLVLFVDLLGDWSSYPNNGKEERNKMWERKQIRLKAVNFTNPEDDRKITVQEGFWFSSHEQWKLMVLPYLEIPLLKQVFTNSEYVRVVNSIQLHIPGLFASSHAPPDVECGRLGGYCNAVGIQAVASQPVHWDQSVSPYGAYPVMLVDLPSGLAWYNTMLSLPKMQTVTGSVEAARVDGTSVASILTWDTKVTSVVAMLRGTGPLISKLLKEDGLSEQFQERVSTFYGEKFSLAMSSAPGQHLPKPPPQLLPSHWAERNAAFPSCRCDLVNGTRRLSESLIV